MNRAPGLLLTALAVVAALLLSARFLPIQAQEPGLAREQVSTHGGKAWIGREHAFEVVRDGRQVRLYGYDRKGEPCDLDGLVVQAKLLPMSAGAAALPLVLERGSSARHSFLVADLGPTARSATSIRFVMAGLKGAIERQVTFEISLAP
ncbi:MAG: hypothetical protein U1E76_28520 [Planctomycetota bacterium]